MTRAEELAELNQAFDAPGSTMHLETYKAKLAAIGSRSDETPAPAAPAKPASIDDKPVSHGFLKNFSEQLLSAMARSIVEQIDAPTKQRISALEERVRALEEKPHLKYLGVYDEARQYGHGDVVTESGSMWHCNRSTRAKPGTSDDWQLCVKRGRDAR